MADMNLRVIIAGGGKVGLRATELLDERGADVVVIEKDPDRCRKISDRYVATIIQGDATDPDIFEQTDPKQANALAALTSDPEANRTICQMGRRHKADLRTVMRTDAAPEEPQSEMVDAIIYPEQASALLAVNAILGGDVRSLEDVMGTLRILEVRIADAAPAAGKTLDAISLPRGMLVISGHEGHHIAGPDTVLEAGKQYIVAMEPDVVEEALQLLRG